MKRIIIIVFSLWVSQSFSQIGFKKHIISSDSITGTDKMTLLGDMDSDGDVDIVGYSEGESLRWYENIDGEGIFSAAKIIDSAIMYSAIKQILDIDVDSDGDLDILTVSLSSHWGADYELAYYKNLDGAGTFSNAFVFCYLDLESLFVRDIDNDGDSDILAYAENTLSLIENVDGQGYFADPVQIMEVESESSKLYIEDMDMDGDYDLLFSLFDTDEMLIYQNENGLGNLGEPVHITLDGNLNGVVIVDVDNDNDMDLIVRVNNDIGLFKNVENSFTFIEYFFNQYIIRSMTTMDVDCDNDMDFIICDSDGVSWFENLNGQGVFGEKKLLIPKLQNGDQQHIMFEDFNMDGRTDILLHTQFAGALWYANIDNGGVFEYRQTISEPNFNTSRIFLTDRDGDGDKDIIYSSQGRFIWIENLGDNVFSRQYDFFPYTKYSSIENIMDLEEDGDMDLLLTIDNWLFNMENMDGIGTYAPPDSMFIYASYYPGGARFKDMDGDGLEDIVVNDYNELYWEKNVMGESGFGEKHTICEGHISTVFYAVEDLDGDGDNDVIIVTDYSFLGEDLILLYENTDGNGNFSGPVVAEYQSNIYYCKLIDIDSDGDMDFIYRRNGSVRCRRYDNGSLGEEEDLGFNGYYFQASDIDNDGDVDLYTNEHTDSCKKLVWYENVDGNGNFEKRNYIASHYDIYYFFLTDDFDEDGDEDLFLFQREATNGAKYSEFVWYENLLINTIEENEKTEIDCYPNPATNIVRIKSNQRIVKVEIFDSLGQNVLSLSDANEIDISALDKGIYILLLTDKTGLCYSKKIVKN